MYRGSNDSSEESEEEGFSLCYTKPPPAHLDCPICLATLVKPVSLSGCSHLVCRGCRQSWSSPKPQCPVCRAPAPQAFHSTFAQNVIDDLEIYCPYGVERIPGKGTPDRQGLLDEHFRLIPGGCRQKIKKGKLAEHLKVCKIATLSKTTNGSQTAALESQITELKNQLSVATAQRLAFKAQNHQLQREIGDLRALNQYLADKAFPVADHYNTSNILALTSILLYFHWDPDTEQFGGVALDKGKIFDAVKRIYISWVYDKLPVHDSHLEALLYVASNCSLFTSVQLEHLERWEENFENDDRVLP